MHTQFQKRYLELTTQILPDLANNSGQYWPVSEDHCFARIVLDNICQDVWYKHIPSPAYLHMSNTQLEQAISLCEHIVSSKVDLHQLNQRSLAWRKAQNDSQTQFNFSD